MANISILTPFLRSGRRRSGRRAVVLDGGLATEFERMGKDLSSVRCIRTCLVVFVWIQSRVHFIQVALRWKIRDCLREQAV